MIGVLLKASKFYNKLHLDFSHLYENPRISFALKSTHFAIRGNMGFEADSNSTRTH